MEVKPLVALTFDRPIHLHIDNDVIDARFVPTNNYAVPNGPSLFEVIDACVALAGASLNRASPLFELIPAHDESLISDSLEVVKA